RGSSNHRDGLWQGFLGDDLDVVIDMGSEMPVNSVQVNFLQASRSWIFLPEVVEYSLSSDGKKYHSFNEVTHNVSQQEKEAVIQPFNIQRSDPSGITKGKGCVDSALQLSIYVRHQSPVSPCKSQKCKSLSRLARRCRAILLDVRR
ncbi:MAG TPA: hypothetical protein PK892_03480, partial [Bacteroidales bacterium]|nr:hypothetical protein [Bacteroidales bacterium]